MYPKTPFQYAVKKYGTDSFQRSILYVFDNEEDAYNKEFELVNLEFIQQEHVYNIALGGKYLKYILAHIQMRVYNNDTLL